MSGFTVHLGHSGAHSLARMVAAETVHHHAKNRATGAVPVTIPTEKSLLEIRVQGIEQLMDRISLELTNHASQGIDPSTGLFTRDRMIVAQDALKGKESWLNDAIRDVMARLHKPSLLHADFTLPAHAGLQDRIAVIKSSLAIQTDRLNEMLTTDYSDIVVARHNLDLTLNGIAENPAESEMASSKFWKQVGLFVDCLESAVDLRSEEAPDARKAFFAPYLDRFQGLTNKWKLNGSSPLERVYHHVYQIAHAKDSSVGGDRWGEHNALLDKERLKEALARVKAEFSQFIL